MLQVVTPNAEAGVDVMRMTIWKFEVLPDAFVVEMPRGAKLLSAQLQPTLGKPQLWVLVDQEQPKVRRRLVTVGTGHPLPPEILGFTFVGTFQLHGGGLVFHLFDAGEET